MKNILIAIIVSLVSVGSLIAQKSQVDQVKATVDGLGCPFCAFGLEKKIKKIDGIKDIAIEMETGVLTFTTPAENNLSLAEVQKKVDDAGYSPRIITITRADGTVLHHEVDLSDKELTVEEEANFWVNGNCDMCKIRIEKAVRNVDGVGTTKWNKKQKNLYVKFDPNITDLASIEAAVAAAGYETKSVAAEDEAYENLPACCQYDRETK